MLFRKDMSGYPLGIFLITIFPPSNLFSGPSGCSLATSEGTDLLPAVLARTG